MSARPSHASVPTEPLLGPWSLTAFAALFVAGGILVLLPAKPSLAGMDGGVSSLHPVERRATPSKSPPVMQGAVKADKAAFPTLGQEGPAPESPVTPPER